MKPNTTLSIRRTSRLKTVAVVVVTAVAALGLPAQAWALEPEPSSFTNCRRPPRPQAKNPQPAVWRRLNPRRHPARGPDGAARTALDGHRSREPLT